MLSLIKTISLPQEAYLEKWARLFRYNQSLVIIKYLLQNRNNKIKILDIGCGQDTLFYKYIKYHFPNDIHRFDYTGIDPLIKTKQTLDRINIIESSYESYFKKTKNKYDFVTLFAVLEHVDSPKDLLFILSKVLNKNGILIGTTPSFFSKPVLEVLSYRMGLISEREIEEHKNYFSKNTMNLLFKEISKTFPKYYFNHDYFEFGLNNLFTIVNHN